VSERDGAVGPRPHSMLDVRVGAAILTRVASALPATHKGCTKSLSCIRTMWFDIINV
jgi:hypothetical protein